MQGTFSECIAVSVVRLLARALRWAPAVAVVVVSLSPAHTVRLPARLLARRVVLNLSLPARAVGPRARERRHRQARHAARHRVRARCAR